MFLVVVGFCGVLRHAFLEFFDVLDGFFDSVGQMVYLEIFLLPSFFSEADLVGQVAAVGLGDAETFLF